MEACTKKQERWQRARQAVLRSLAPTAVMAVLWLVLGWVRSAGIQLVVLWPLYFLTGALNGLSGSTLGGAVGKTLLLVMLNSFIKGVVVRSRGADGRRKNFWQQFKADASNALLARIPQFFNLKKLWKAGSLAAAGCGGLGLAAAILVYPFLTGDGSFVNSMVCVALCVSIFGQLARQWGLLIALLNLLLARRGGRTLDRQPLELFFTGTAVGMAASVAISLTQSLPVAGDYIWFALARVLPVVLAVASLAAIFWVQLDKVMRKSSRGAALADRAQRAGAAFTAAHTKADNAVSAAAAAAKNAAKRKKEGEEQ